MLEGVRIGAIAAAVALLAAISGTSFAAQKIGVAGAVKNDVQGDNQKLAPGSQLFEQEVVKTGADSLAQLMFLDETSLSVGPKAQVKLDKFVYDPNRKLGNVVLSATKGAFRFIDGRQDPRTYTLKTPVATIGMRGSTIDCYVFADGTFCMCTFWFAECLARGGDVQRARFVFEKMLGYANHVGLFGEQLGPAGEHLGNFPQAFTHLGLSPFGKVVLRMPAYKGG